MLIKYLSFYYSICSILSGCKGDKQKKKNNKLCSNSGNNKKNDGIEKEQDDTKKEEDEETTQNPPKTDDIQQLYTKFSNLYEYVFNNYGKVNSTERLNIDGIKNQVEKNRNDIDKLKKNINLLESEKNKIDVIIKEEEKKNKKPDPNKDKDGDPNKDEDKDKDKDKNKIGEIQSIFNDIESVDIEEKLDTTGININFINKDKFVFKYSNDEREEKKSLTEKDFTILDDLIKHFLAKKKLKGNFTINWLDNGHVGINPVLKIKITNDNLKTTFCAFIKNEHIKDFMLFMFKGFQILDLLPFEYYVDLKNNLMITEDVVEKGFSFLDNEYVNITDKNKEIWKNCTNMNEFRFWCYLLVCDDIDPMYKYDNCCFKDNKVYALDIRINRTVDLDLGNYRIDNFMFGENYDKFMKNCFLINNSDDIKEHYKNSDRYKIWKKSIDDFKDFSNDEKNSINEKLIKLLSYFIGICKHYNWKNKKEIMNQTKYIQQVIRNMMNFLTYYVEIYKKKYDKFEYNKETLTYIYDCARYREENYSNEKADFIFKTLIDDKKLELNYFLNSENLVKLYDIHRNIPLSSDVHGILPYINFGV